MSGSTSGSAEEASPSASRLCAASASATPPAASHNITTYGTAIWGKSSLLMASARAIRSGALVGASERRSTRSAPPSASRADRECRSHPAAESPSPTDAGTTTVRAVFCKKRAIRSRISRSFMVGLPTPSIIRAHEPGGQDERKERTGLGADAHGNSDHSRRAQRSATDPRRRQLDHYDWHDGGWQPHRQSQAARLLTPRDDQLGPPQGAPLGRGHAPPWPGHAPLRKTLAPVPPRRAPFRKTLAPGPSRPGPHQGSLAPLPRMPSLLPQGPAQVEVEPRSIAKTLCSTRPAACSAGRQSCSRPSAPSTAIAKLLLHFERVLLRHGWVRARGASTGAVRRRTNRSDPGCRPTSSSVPPAAASGSWSPHC